MTKKLREELQSFKDEARERKKKESTRIENNWLFSRIGLLCMIALPVSMLLMEYSWAAMVDYWFKGWAMVGLVWFISWFMEAGKENKKLMRDERGEEEDNHIV